MEKTMVFPPLREAAETPLNRPDWHTHIHVLDPTRIFSMFLKTSPFQPSILLFKELGHFTIQNCTTRIRKCSPTSLEYLSTTLHTCRPRSPARRLPSQKLSFVIYTLYPEPFRTRSRRNFAPISSISTLRTPQHLETSSSSLPLDQYIL